LVKAQRPFLTGNLADWSELESDEKVTGKKVNASFLTGNLTDYHEIDSAYFIGK
jgi:hypothetical protein